MLPDSFTFFLVLIINSKAIVLGISCFVLNMVRIGYVFTLGNNLWFNGHIGGLVVVLESLILNVELTGRNLVEKVGISILKAFQCLSIILAVINISIDDLLLVSGFKIDFFRRMQILRWYRIAMLLLQLSTNKDIAFESTVSSRPYINHLNLVM
jgi:hypothetical protein